jgi:nicotinamidase-related amidase
MKTVLLDPADTVMLLLDHQNGLFQTVKDVPLAELRTNTVVLAKVAKLANIPLITTASVPDGPNGPLMHELQEVTPDATYVPRKGEISAWDNGDFVRTTTSRWTRSGFEGLSRCSRSWTVRWSTPPRRSPSWPRVPCRSAPTGRRWECMAGTAGEVPSRRAG